MKLCVENFQEIKKTTENPFIINKDKKNNKWKEEKKQEINYIFNKSLDQTNY